MIRAAYFKNEETKIRCLLCPHRCIIQCGGFGICGVRKNEKSELVLPYAGIISSASLDPIEKKPLYHFYPGKKIYSIGFYGCNFHCPFCQNYSISQEVPFLTTDRTTPEEVVQEARKHSSFAIAYTYSEPLVHFEFVLQTSILARKAGLKNVLISNGFINSEPLYELLPYLDGVNIDLKSYNEDFYVKEIGGKRGPVLDFIRLAAGKVHLEVTTLIIPDKNDSPEETRQIARFLAGVDKNIPLHLSCYFPRYKYTIRQTLRNDLIPLLNAAREYLPYVYLGNSGEEVDTICPQCGNIVIRRFGYTISLTGLSNNRCTRCLSSLPIITE